MTEWPFVKNRLFAALKEISTEMRAINRLQLDIFSLRLMAHLFALLIFWGQPCNFYTILFL